MILMVLGILIVMKNKEYLTNVNDSSKAHDLTSLRAEAWTNVYDSDKALAYRILMRYFDGPTPDERNNIIL